MDVNWFVLSRILLGGLLVFSGFEKLTSPYQNFLYVVQSYDLVSHPLDEWVARFFPWGEFFAGVFIFLGLWTAWALRGSLILFTIFIGVVGQALIRQLPITECGCFGEALNLSLRTVLLLDSMLWLLTVKMLLNVPKVASLSVDQYFEKNSP